MVDELSESIIWVNVINLGGICIVMCVKVYLVEDVDKLKILFDIMLFYLYLMVLEGCEVYG